MSADYQLMSPSTGHDIVVDIKDLFLFLSERLNLLLLDSGKTTQQIDPNSIIVSGSSAGGLCSYLAAIHAHPKPKGVLSLYGQGGDFLVCFLRTSIQMLLEALTRYIHNPVAAIPGD